MQIRIRVIALAAGVALACAGASTTQEQVRPRVLPGVSVLVRDSLALIRGKRVGLITNQTGLTEKGETDIDVLFAALGGRGGGLTALFSPEHGIRGTEDRSNIESGIDAKTGLPVHSLFTTQAVPPADSLLRNIDVLLIDLFDIGTRTWTYVGTTLYAMRAAARRGIPVFVLDRPNPLGGRVEGPMLDSSIANPADPTTSRPGRAYALYRAPLRHGLTMGELAKWFNDELGIKADLHVIPAEGWHRGLWWDSTGLPWVRPSPNIPTLNSALVYPALVALEGSNVSVGRGTELAFQRFGASWLDASRVAALLESRALSGVRFVAETFRPEAPGDNKFTGRTIPGVRIEVLDRDRVQVARVGAAVVWALNKIHKDSLRIVNASFDLRWGSAKSREALLSAEDPDRVIDGEVPDVAIWQQKMRRYLLYR